MGAVVSALAFPAPACSRELRASLRKRPDFLSLTTSDGYRIGALHIRRNTGRTILYSHGNAEAMALLCAADVMAYDYCGYGISEGTPSEDGCYSAIDAAYKYLIELGIIPTTIIAYGRSLGSGPTVDLVARHPEIRAMVLQSPLESVGRAGLGCCGLGRFASCMLYDLDMFRNYEKIEDVQCPVFIIHGQADRIVPLHNGEALFEACSSAAAPFWVPGCGHNDLPYDVCLVRVREFLDALEQEAAARKALPTVSGAETSAIGKVSPQHRAQVPVTAAVIAAVPATNAKLVIPAHAQVVPSQATSTVTSFSYIPRSTAHSRFVSSPARQVMLTPARRSLVPTTTSFPRVSISGARTPASLSFVAVPSGVPSGISTGRGLYT